MSSLQSPYYYLTKEQIEAYHQNGFLHISNVAPLNILKQLDESFTNFTSDDQGIKKIGNDFADINGETGKSLESVAGVSIMLPRNYCTNLDLSILESRCAHITQQLLGDGMVFDFDRFIAKKPNREDAVFHWHQDKLYCLTHGDAVDVQDSRVSTFSIALDDTTEENGCIKYVVGSHKEDALRKHIPAHSLEDKKSALFTVTKTIIDEDKDKDKIVAVPIKRGDLTVHGERIVHGSGGNKSKGWRRSYMIQFRSKEAVNKRIALGISRSFNDMPNMVSKDDTVLNRSISPTRA